MRQPTKPCAGCPFVRESSMSGDDRLGGGQPLTYVGQIAGCFWLPCHECYDPEVHPKQQDPTKVGQCAGAAIFRTHVGASPPIAGLNENTLMLPEDKERVFATYAEFLAYHAKVPLSYAEDFLRQVSPQMLARMELKAEGAKIMLVPRQ